MAPSRTLDVGLDGHHESMAVASVAQADGAEVSARGPVGTRQGALDQRLRHLRSKRTPLVLVSEAGPGGSGLARELTPQGHGCGVVAPAVLPQQPGDRVHTARREAIPVARLMRSGDLPPVSVPAGPAAARRDLSRARAETRHALKTATCRRNAVLRRPDSRAPGRATWGPAHRRWRSAVVWPPPPSPASAKTMAGRAPHTLTGSRAGHRVAARRGR